MPGQDMRWWVSGKGAELTAAMISKAFSNLFDEPAPHVWQEPPEEDRWPEILAHPDTSSLIIVPGASRCGHCGTYLCETCGCDFWTCLCHPRSAEELERARSLAVYPKP